MNRIYAINKSYAEYKKKYFKFYLRRNIFTKIETNYLGVKHEKTDFYFRSFGYGRFCKC